MSTRQTAFLCEQFCMWIICKQGQRILSKNVQNVYTTYFICAMTLYILCTIMYLCSQLSQLSRKGPNVTVLQHCECSHCLCVMQLPWQRYQSESDEESELDELELEKPFIFSLGNFDFILDWNLNGPRSIFSWRVRACVRERTDVWICNVSLEYWTWEYD